MGTWHWQNFYIEMWGRIWLNPWMIQTSKAVWVWEHFGLQKWGWTCPWGEMIISQMAELSLKVKCQSLSRVQLCNSMDCRPPGSSVHGICQVTILEWVAIPFSRGSSLLRDWTRVSSIAGGLYHLSHQGSPELGRVNSRNSNHNGGWPD